VSFVRKDLDDGINLKNVPAFPGKKVFKAMDPAFLSSRMQAL